MLDRDKVALNLTETHKTVENIKARKGFVVHITDTDSLFFFMKITPLPRKGRCNRVIPATQTYLSSYLSSFLICSVMLMLKPVGLTIMVDLEEPVSVILSPCAFVKPCSPSIL